MKLVTLLKHSRYTAKMPLEFKFKVEMINACTVDI